MSNCVLAATLLALAADGCPEVEFGGEGDTTVLIVPAMSARWSVWAGFMERNSGRYTTCAVTPPGFGGVPAPALPLDSSETPWTEYALDAIEAVIDEHELTDIVLIGHSWGAGIAVQLAGRRPEVVRAIVNVDGLVTMDPTREPLGPEAWRAEADAQVLDPWRERLEDPDEWARFNGWPIELDRRSALVYGMGMATPKEVVLQCWREMWMWDLNPIVRELDVPLLDLRALRPNDPDPNATRTAYLARLESIGTPESHRPVFLFDTLHAIEGQRPLVFDDLVQRFLAGESTEDYVPD